MKARGRGRRRALQEDSCFSTEVQQADVRFFLSAFRIYAVEVAKEHALQILTFGVSFEAAGSRHTGDMGRGGKKTA